MIIVCYVQGLFSCFSQNLPKGEIVNSLFLWLTLILVKPTWQQHDEQDVSTCRLPMLNVMS